MKIQKKKLGGGGRVGVGVGGSGRCKRRIEVFVKLKKNIFVGGGLVVGGSVGSGLWGSG